MCFINCLFPSVCIIVSEIYMPLRRLCIIFNRRCDRLLSLSPVCDKVTSYDADEDFVHTCWVGAMSFFPDGYSIVKWFPAVSSPLCPSLSCLPPNRLNCLLNLITARMVYILIWCSPECTVFHQGPWGRNTINLEDACLLYTKNIMESTVGHQLSEGIYVIPYANISFWLSSPILKTKAFFDSMDGSPLRWETEDINLGWMLPFPELLTFVRGPNPRPRELCLSLGCSVLPPEAAETPWVRPRRASF